MELGITSDGWSSMVEKTLVVGEHASRSISVPSLLMNHKISVPIQVVRFEQAENSRLLSLEEAYR